VHASSGKDTHLGGTIFIDYICNHITSAAQAKLKYKCTEVECELSKKKNLILLKTCIMFTEA
jgi:hypothetical protein